jgi:hypothetical protein
MRYIAEACIRAGHQVSCLDLCFEDPSASKQVIRHHIDNHKPDVIGISLRNLDVEDPDKLARYNYANYNLATYNLANYSLATYSTYESDNPSNLECFDQALDACRTFSDSLVVLGGPAFTLLPKQFLTRYAGAVGIVGPGERSFLDLIKAIEDGKDIRDVSGVVTTESSDEAFSHISMDPLSTVPSTEEAILSSYSIRGGEYNIQSKRGCEFKCIHCSYPLIEGNRVRTHNPVEIGERIAQLTKKAVTQFRFVDSVFNNPVDHAIAVCNEISGRVCSPIEFTVNCSPAHFTHELAQALKAAGCNKVIFGTDTASSEMLKVMRKPFSRRQIAAVTSICKSLNLYFEHHMLLGAPGETLESALESLTFMDSLACPVFIDLGIQIYDRAPIAKLLRSPASSNDQFVPPIFIEPTISRELPDLIVDFCALRSNLHTFIVRDSHPHISDGADGFLQEEQTLEETLTNLRVQRAP